MNSVERVKAICKERKIPISRLEKDLGFGNGYLSSLTKGEFPSGRLYAIAEYLGLSPAYLLSGEDEKNAPTDRERVSDEDIKFALFGGDGEITDAMFEEVRAFAAFVKEREAKKKE